MNKTALAGLGVFTGAIGFLAATTWQASSGKGDLKPTASSGKVQYQMAGTALPRAQISATKTDEGANNLALRNGSIAAGNKRDQRRFQAIVPNAPSGRPNVAMGQYEHPRYRSQQYRRPYYRDNRRSYRPRYDYREQRRRTRRSYAYGPSGYRRFYNRYDRQPRRYRNDRNRRYNGYRRYRQYKRYSRYRPYGRYNRYDRARRNNGYKGSNRQRRYTGFSRRQGGNRGADISSSGAFKSQFPYGKCRPKNQQSEQSRKTAKRTPYPAREMPQGNQDQIEKKIFRPRVTRAI